MKYEFVEMTSRKLTCETADLAWVTFNVLGCKHSLNNMFLIKTDYSYSAFAKSRFQAYGGNQYSNNSVHITLV